MTASTRPTLGEYHALGAGALLAGGPCWWGPYWQGSLLVGVLTGGGLTGGGQSMRTGLSCVRRGIHDHVWCHTSAHALHRTRATKERYGNGTDGFVKFVAEQVRCLMRAIVPLPVSGRTGLTRGAYLIALLSTSTRSPLFNPPTCTTQMSKCVCPPSVPPFTQCRSLFDHSASS